MALLRSETTFRKTITAEEGNAEDFSADYRYQALRNVQISTQGTGEAGVARLFPAANDLNLSGTFAVLSDSLTTSTLNANGSIVGPSGGYTKSLVVLGHIRLHPRRG